MKPRIVLLRGLPGCGKSTWARAWVAADPAGRVRVCRDDLRAMMRNGVNIDGVTERAVLAARNAIISAAIREGLDVVVDETALPETTVEAVRRLAVRCKVRLVIEDMRGVPLESCIARDAARPAPVGEDIIRGYHAVHLRKAATGDPQ